MWLLSFIPSWFAFLLITVSVVGILLTYLTGIFTRIFPTLLPSLITIRTGLIVLLLVSTFIAGIAVNEERHDAEIAEMKEKVKESEKKAAEATARIEYVFLDRVKVVRDTQVVIQEKIKEVEKLIDSKCTITPEAIDILNSAAKGNLVGVKK